MQPRILAVMMLVACGGTYGGQPPAHPTQAVAEKPKRGIEDAGLPYTVLDAKTGHQIDTNGFWGKLGTERVVCVGEEHNNPHHHWVELEVVRRMMKAWPAGSPRALGMEMFQRPFQGVLDDFAAKRIDENALRSRTGWEDRWGYDFGFYRPTIAAAVDAHATLLALNAAKELTKKVAHHGLESLTPEERVQLAADLDLKDKAHRAWFDALMSDMSGGDPHNAHASSGSGSGSGGSADMPSEDAIYTVQVIWDETMADTAAKWLQANRDGRIVILAGSGHCHDSAIVNRIKRRGIADVVSIRSVIDDGQGGVAEELAKPMTDFLVVLDMPEDVKKQLREQNKE
ncbi:MAG TPA: ChaN family lipoprotein [Kofleriaceae bacterium]